MNRFIVCMFFIIAPNLALSKEELPDYLVKDIVEFLKKEHGWSCDEYIIGNEYYDFSVYNQSKDNVIKLRVTHRDDLLFYTDAGSESNKSLAIEYDLVEREVLKSLYYQ